MVSKDRALLAAVYGYLRSGGEVDTERIVKHLQEECHGFDRKPYVALKKAVAAVLRHYGEDKEEAPAKVRKVAPNFASLAGLDEVLETVQNCILTPLLHPEKYRAMGIPPERGVLLCGPPGSGKTALAHALREEVGCAFYELAATEVVAGTSGESEKRLRDFFQQAQENAPSVLFIDEIDAITGKRSQAERGLERRIVTQLLACMDQLDSAWQLGKLVIVLGATNRIEAIDPALRRAGRFDREIHFGIPNQDAREQILRVLVKPCPVHGALDLTALARSTAGYVGADLRSLVTEAGTHAIRRQTDSADCFLEMQDFLHALTQVQPSSKREGFTTVPDTCWEDIGGLQELREELTYAIVKPIQDPQRYKQAGITMAAGVLLCGPPGCGKTLVAKAVAHESGANFIAVNGPELLNKYVGESERAVRQVFQRARDSSPCIIFFDEIDSLCAQRGGENQATERVVNQLLTELNGIQDRAQVFVVAATNRMDIIDPAILRGGRLGTKLFVPLPKLEDRVAILRAATRHTPLSSDINFQELAELLEGYSGADLASVVREAACLALREEKKEVLVTQAHLLHAGGKVRASVTREQREHYDRQRSLCLRS